MNLDMWVRYGSLGASSRLRFYQYVPYLEDEGIFPQVYNFFDDDYLRDLYSGRPRQLSGVLRSYFSRLKDMCYTEDGVPALIEYELLPHLPYFMEKWFLRKRSYILNFDDAVDLHYEKVPFLREKYPQLIANAAGIIAANDNLLERFRQYNEKILKLPTVPPVEIHPVSRRKPEKLTLVWTGTPVTYQFLYERRQALRMAAEKTDFELLVVASENLPRMEGVNCRYFNWNQETETTALSKAHAGLMPLPDTPFARGKSAYKLICFLRAGIPGIASPVGENCRVIENGVNGMLALSDEEWVQAIAALENADLRQKLMQGAKASAEKFHLPECAGKLAAFIRSVFPSCN